MSGQLPIDRARENQVAPEIQDEHRERFAEKQAKLARTDDVREGEQPPGPPGERPGSSPDDRPTEDGTGRGADR